MKESESVYACNKERDCVFVSEHQEVRSVTVAWSLYLQRQQCMARLCCRRPGATPTPLPDPVPAHCAALVLQHYSKWQ